VSNVFVIINEWQSSIDDATGSGIVDYKFFESESAAWFALRDIAHAFEDDIDYDATSYTIESPSVGLDYEEYYIQELTKA